jgi:hypothetical protein
MGAEIQGAWKPNSRQYGEPYMIETAKQFDALFGFSSPWSFTLGAGCWENRGAINIDEDEVGGIIKGAGIDTAGRDLIVRFIMGHEKGHHLQEMIWPNRKYATEHHVMEIEADLIGAWALASRNSAIATQPLLDIVKQFDDVNRIAQRLGVTIGDTEGNAPHHPWPEQRELALVRGPEIAILYPSLPPDMHRTFAEDIRAVAEKIVARGL